MILSVVYYAATCVFMSWFVGLVYNLAAPWLIKLPTLLAEHYYVLGLISAALAVSLAVFTDGGLDLERVGSDPDATSSLTVIVWVPVVHWLFVSRFFYSAGRNWEGVVLNSINNYSLFRGFCSICGCAFGVYVSELSSRARLKSKVMLLFTSYAVVGTQYANFPVNLDVTSVWLGATALMAFQESNVTVMVGVAGLAVLRSFLDGYTPTDKKKNPNKSQAKPFVPPANPSTARDLDEMEQQRDSGAGTSQLDGMKKQKKRRSKGKQLSIQ